MKKILIHLIFFLPIFAGAQSIYDLSQDTKATALTKRVTTAENNIKSANTKITNLETRANAQTAKDASQDARVINLEAQAQFQPATDSTQDERLNALETAPTVKVDTATSTGSVKINYVSDRKYEITNDTATVDKPGNITPYQLSLIQQALLNTSGALLVEIDALKQEIAALKLKIATLKATTIIE